MVAEGRDYGGKWNGPRKSLNIEGQVSRCEELDPRVQFMLEVLMAVKNNNVYIRYYWSRELAGGGEEGGVHSCFIISLNWKRNAFH